MGNTWKPESPFELSMPDPDTINKKVMDGTEPLMLACIVTGKFKTNFPDGIEVEAKEEEGDEDKDEDAKKDDDATQEDDEKAGDKGEAGAKGQPAGEGEAKPKDEEKKAEPTDKPKDDADAKEGSDKEDKEAEKDDEEKEPEREMKRLTPVTEAAEGATVIVVADVDMLTDMLAYERTFFGMALSGDNASFVFNTLDYLSGSEDLIKIRSRGRYGRPFKVVDQIEQEADRATSAEVKAINEKIEKYEKELKELGGAATEKNIQLIQSEAVAKRRKIEAQIREANKELRRLQAKRREQVEALGLDLKLANILIAPTIILVIAIVLAVVRWFRAKQYAARRA